MSAEWDPDEALQGLKLEASTTGITETNATLASRLLDEAAPQAVLALTHLAWYSTNERIRLEAAKVVLDRVLGRTSDTQPTGIKDPFDKVTAWLTEPTTSSTSSKEAI